MTEKPSIGFIQLVYFGHESGEVLTLGGAGFVTKKEDQAAWDALPAASGETDFIADRMDAERDIYDDRRITRATVESLLGKPLSKLVAAAWKKLQAEKQEYLMAAA